MRTAITGIKRKRGGQVEVQTTYPDAIFTCEKDDLADPFRFAVAMRKYTRGHATGPLFQKDHPRYPRTKGQLRDRWAQFLEVAS